MTGTISAVAAAMGGLVLASASARAQPAAPAAEPPSTPEGAPMAAVCGVRLGGIDEALRRRLEDEIAAEGVCGGALDVWLTTGTNGVIVVARDQLGRTRTRVVASIDVVPSLIASWVVVDDGNGGTAIPAPPAPAPPASPSPAPAKAAARPPVASPSTPLRREMAPRLLEGPPGASAPTRVAADVDADADEFGAADAADGPSIATHSVGVRPAMAWSGAVGLSEGVAGNAFRPTRLRLEGEMRWGNWRWGTALDAYYETPIPDEFADTDHRSGVAALGTLRYVVLSSQSGTTQIPVGVGFGVDIESAVTRNLPDATMLHTVDAYLHAEATVGVRHALTDHWTAEVRTSAATTTIDPLNYRGNINLGFLVGYQ